MTKRLLLTSCLVITGCYSATAGVDAGRDAAASPAPDAAPPDATTSGVDAFDPTPFDGGPGSYSREKVAAARALCDGPHGPAVVDLTTRAPFTSHLARAWLLCSVSDPIDPVRSIVYGADGTWHYLLDDGHGGLVPGIGLDSVGTWKLSDEMGGWPPDAGPPDMPTNGTVGRFTLPGNGFIAEFPGFETAPDRMGMLIGTAGFHEWYVPLDDGTVDPVPDPGTPPPWGTPPADGASFDATQVADAQRRCADPTHGAVAEASTRGTFTGIVARAWLLCSSTGSVSQSITYTADGHWHYLVADGSGGLVAAVGLDSTGTWELGDGMGTPTPSGPPDQATYGYVQRDVGTASFFTQFVGFESWPERMEILNYDVREWYVPLY